MQSIAATTVVARVAAAAPRARSAAAGAPRAAARPASRVVSKVSTRKAVKALAASTVGATATDAKKNTVVDAAIANPDFSVLVEAVVKANLASALSGPGPFTVFAPTNEAFVAALGALKLSKQQLLDLPTLSNILKFHVVSGKVMSSQLSNGMEAATLEGSKVKFDVGSAGVKVNGAKVVKADIEVDNGVIHVISSVILPPPKVEDYIKGMAGISAPFGLFDPAGFLNDQTISEVKRLRESEIVHGRLAMLAALGFLVGESGATPLFNGEIQGLAINQFQQVPAGFEAAVTLAIGVAEAGRASKGWVEPGNGLFQLRESYQPGDLAWDPLGLKPTDAAGLKEMQTKEINNGRLAMLAIAAFVVQEEISGLTIAEQLK